MVEWFMVNVHQLGAFLTVLLVLAGFVVNGIIFLILAMGVDSFLDVVRGMRERKQQLY